MTRINEQKLPSYYPQKYSLVLQSVAHLMPIVAHVLPLVGVSANWKVAHKPATKAAQYKEWSIQIKRKF